MVVVSTVKRFIMGLLFSEPLVHQIPRIVMDEDDLLIQNKAVMI